MEKPNRAKELIEDFMIAANGVTARYLSSRKFPSLRRVVRTPKRWDRIVELARQHGCKLPAEPDPRPLEQFLVKQKAADPLRFPDLSLAVIKLMGPGEYVADCPGDAAPPGHFGLAVEDYTHSTAPNRRYPDIITQRLLKAALARQPAPYGNDDLEALADHCTQEEDAAKKVERQVGKSAAAMLLESRIGEQFDAIVTGAPPRARGSGFSTLPWKGNWCRVSRASTWGRGFACNCCTRTWSRDSSTSSATADAVREKGDWLRGASRFGSGRNVAATVPVPFFRLAGGAGRGKGDRHRRRKPFRQGRPIEATEPVPFPRGPAHAHIPPRKCGNSKISGCTGYRR